MESGEYRMFKNLNRKITIYMTLAIFLFVFLIGLVSTIVVSQSYIRTFQESATETVKIAINYSEIKLENIITDGEKIATDDIVVTGLSGSDYVITINPKLNFLRSLYQEEIIGLTIYGLNNRLYKTDSLSIQSIIPFSELTQIPDIAAFIASEANFELFVLDNGSAVYAFSLFYKIQSETLEDLGYLLININPDYLFTEYFRFEQASNLELLESKILMDDTLYLSMNASPSTPSLLGTEPIESGFIHQFEQYVVKERLYRDDVFLVSVVDTATLQGKILLMITYMGSAIIGFTIIAYVASKQMAKAISTRLTRLSKRMTKATEKINP